MRVCVYGTFLYILFSHYTGSRFSSPMQNTVTPRGRRRALLCCTVKRKRVRSRYRDIRYLSLLARHEKGGGCRTFAHVERDRRAPSRRREILITAVLIVARGKKEREREGEREMEKERLLQRPELPPGDSLALFRRGIFPSSNFV